MHINLLTSCELGSVLETIWSEPRMKTNKQTNQPKKLGFVSTRRSQSYIKGPEIVQPHCDKHTLQRAVLSNGSINSPPDTCEDGNAGLSSKSRSYFPEAPGLEPLWIRVEVEHGSLSTAWLRIRYHWPFNDSCVCVCVGGSCCWGIWASCKNWMTSTSPPVEKQGRHKKPSPRSGSQSHSVR